MSKRVHEIAKERGLPPREILERLRAAGMNVKSVSSGVDEDTALKALGLEPLPKPAAPAKAPAANGNGSAPPAGDGAPAPKPAAGQSRAAQAEGQASRPAQRPSAPAAPRQAAPAAPRQAAPAAPRQAAPAAPRQAAPAASRQSAPAGEAPATPSRAQANRQGSAPARPAPGQDAPPTRPASGQDAPPPRPTSGLRRVAIEPDRGPGGRGGGSSSRNRPVSGSRPGSSSRQTAGGESPAAAAAAAAARAAMQSRGALPTDPRIGRDQIPTDPRAGRDNAPSDPRAGRQGASARPAGGRPANATDPRGGGRPTPTDPRAGRTASGKPTPTAPAAPAKQPQPEPAPAAEAAPAAEGASAEARGERQRPTRDSLQGERSPGAAGGRRRVVIDSQASRRAPGGGGPQSNQPPRRQRRGRRRRGVYDEEVESRATNALTADQPQNTVRINSGSTVKDVAEYLSVPLAEVMKTLMSLGEMRTLTQTLPDETIEILATELGKEVEIVHTEDEVATEPVYDDAEEDLTDRPPVVTIMGHVDHGKTSLLDAIRETQVAAGEAGGITQHIGAYQVQHDGKTITFLDTPGHEAFTAMRARGAKVTDLAVIVVAADDGVKPQTQEAVDHAKEAGVPILVAVNKIDKEGADPARVRTEMTALGLQPVEWGGDTEFVDVSARTKQGLDNLLETIVVMAEVEELQANPNTAASGTVIESKLDPGRGPVVTILIERGTMAVGDALVAGAHWGRVRAMHDFTGSRVTAARPGEPVEVLGFDGVPEAGEHVRVVDHERRARQLAAERATRLKSESLARRSNKRISLEDIAGGELTELNLLVKADVAGSLEAIEDEIAKLPQEEVSVNVIRRAVGGVTESDVMLAAASDAVILAFNVRPVGDARSVAEREGVEIRGYSVIYRAIEDLRQAMEGMLAPEEVEESLGSAEVRQIFRASRVGTIAGSHVTEGKITRGAKVRLVRDGTVVYDGEIASLRRFNEDVREVAAGFECGIVLRDYADVKEGDVLEAYATRQVERELVS